jgi:hypothetical protein
MHHPFSGPIHSEPRDPSADLRTTDTTCTCPGFCAGRDSADWLSCRASCRHCNPRHRRRRGQGTDGQE